MVNIPFEIRTTGELSWVKYSYGTSKICHFPSSDISKYIEATEHAVDDRAIAYTNNQLTRHGKFIGLNMIVDDDLKLNELLQTAT